MQISPLFSWLRVFPSIGGGMRISIAMVIGNVTVSVAVVAATLEPGSAASVHTIATGGFIQQSFTFNKSLGVGVAYEQNSDNLVVNTGHVKGTRTFGGTARQGLMRVCSLPADIVHGYSVAAPSPVADGCS